MRRDGDSRDRAARHAAEQAPQHRRSSRPGRAVTLRVAAGCCSRLALIPLLVLVLRGGRAAPPARAARPSPRPPTAASVVPRRPGWRRHVPLALSGLALAGLIVALARPQVTVAVPAEQASIVLDDGPLELDAGDRRGADRGWPPPARRARRSSTRVPREGAGRRRRVRPSHRGRARARPRTAPALRAALRRGGGRAAAPPPATRSPPRCDWCEAAAGGRRQAAPGGDRAPLRRQVDPRPRPARGRRRRPREPACRSTPSRSAPAGRHDCPTAERRAARHRTPLQAIAERSGGQAFTARRTRPGCRRRLRAARLAGGEEEGAARGHGRVRRRRDRLLLGGAALSLRWFRRLI